MTESRTWLALVLFAGGGWLLFLLAPVLTPVLVAALVAAPAGREGAQPGPDRSAGARATTVRPHGLAVDRTAAIEARQRTGRDRPAQRRPRQAGRAHPRAVRRRRRTVTCQVTGTAVYGRCADAVGGPGER